MPSIHEGGSSTELKLSYKLLEATEVGTSAIKFPCIFVAWVNSVGQNKVVIRALHI